MSKTGTRIQVEQHLISAMRHTLDTTKRNTDAAVWGTINTAMDILNYEGTLPRKQRDYIRAAVDEINSQASLLIRTTMLLNKLTEQQQDKETA